MKTLGVSDCTLKALLKRDVEYQIYTWKYDSFRGVSGVGYDLSNNQNKRPYLRFYWLKNNKIERIIYLYLSHFLTTIMFIYFNNPARLNKASGRGSWPLNFLYKVIGFSVPP